MGGTGARGTGNSRRRRGAWYPQPGADGPKAFSMMERVAGRRRSAPGRGKAALLVALAASILAPGPSAFARCRIMTSDIIYKRPQRTREYTLRVCRIANGQWKLAD